MIESSIQNIMEGQPASGGAGAEQSLIESSTHSIWRGSQPVVGLGLNSV